MFDLFRSRAKAVRYLLGGLLMLVAISMVVTLIPGYGTGGGSQDQIVAEIGKDVITTREVTQQMQTAMRNRNVPREMAGIFLNQIVDQMITERALIYEAQRLGFQVSDDDIAKAIRMTIPQLFQNGQFVGKDVYAAFLAQQNTTIPEFEANMRNRIVLVRLQNLVAESVVVSSSDIEREYMRRNQKARLEYIALTPARFRSEITVTPDEIRNYYQANKAQFRVPEKRAFDLLVVDEAKVSGRIQVPEAQLRQAYEANKDQFRTPERVRARHIFLKTTDAPKGDIPKIEARAQELRKQVNNANFAELAKKNSQDPGSAAKGGDLDWIVRGQTAKALEDVAFSLKPGEISNVIKTEYGFHILQVLEKEPARLKPFEEVKDQLAAERKKQSLYDTMQKLADQAHDELAKNPQAAPQIAQKLDITLINVPPAGAGDPVPEFGVNPDFQDALSQLQKGGVTPVMQAPGSKLAVAVVTSVVPARDAELSEVEGQIRDRITTEKLKTLFDAKAREAGEKAKSGDLAALARSLGLELKTTQDFSLTGAADGIGPAGIVHQAFEEPVGSVFGPVASSPDQLFICKILSRTPADMSKLSEQRASIADALKSDRIRERYELFEDSVRSALIRKGKVKVHEDVIKRLAATYRS